MNAQKESAAVLHSEDSHNGQTAASSAATPIVLAAFLNFARHNLLAPLTAARSILCELQQDQEHLPVDFARLLNALVGSCDRALAIIDDELPMVKDDDALRSGPIHHLANKVGSIVQLSAELLIHDSQAFERFHRELSIVDYYCREFERRFDDLSACQFDMPCAAAAMATVIERSDSRARVTTPSADGPVTTLRGHVLLVEDDLDARTELSQLLESIGLTVTAAENGEHALRLANEAGPHSINAALLDVNLGATDGCEVLNQLKRRTWMAHVPVIMISGKSQTDIMGKCIAAGADDYLLKPVNRVLLFSRLQNALARVNQHREFLDVKERLKRRSKHFDDILRSLFPKKVVLELMGQKDIRPRRYSELAVMFCDIVGFTAFCDKNQDEPHTVVDKLRNLFESFEQSAEDHKVDKIKTIGDCFMAACWAEDVTNNVESCIRCAMEMRDAAAAEDWKLRIGIHYGTVVAGKVGNRQYCFDLWGDAVNTAARVQTAANIDTITLSHAAFECVETTCRAIDRGDVLVSGKEKPIRMYEFLDFWPK